MQMVVYVKKCSVSGMVVYEVRDDPRSINLNSICVLDLWFVHELDEKTCDTRIPFSA